MLVAVEELVQDIGGTRLCRSSTVILFAGGTAIAVAMHTELSLHLVPSRTFAPLVAAQQY